MLNQLNAYQDLGFYISQKLEWASVSPQLITHCLYNSKVYQIDNLLSVDEVETILTYIKGYPWQPVGLDGVAGNYHMGDTISSSRLGTYDEKMVNLLFNRIKHLLPTEHFHLDYLHAKTDLGDFSKDSQWHFIGLNPYLRYIDYVGNGFLLPHYDGVHVFSDKKRTLMSCLIYLTDNETGKLQFLVDPQDTKKFIERDFNTKNPIKNNEIILEIKPKKGRMVLFDAFLLHQTSEVINEKKTLILSDAIFEK